jgi:hypothetical protein
VNELGCLILNCAHHFGVTMTSRTDGDTSVAIEKDIAVNVFDPNPKRALGY